MAPFGLKLWENAFQTIPDISFFDAKEKMFDKNFRQKQIAALLNHENRQTAYFGGAMNFWMSLADAPLKFIAQTISFSLLRPLAEG